MQLDKDVVYKNVTDYGQKVENTKEEGKLFLKGIL